MKFNQIKSNRIKHTFIGITTFENGWWYHRSKHKWLNHDMPYYESDGDGYCSNQRCNSVRAFRRKLKKCPKVVEFVLASRWKRYDVTGYNTTKTK